MRHAVSLSSRMSTVTSFLFTLFSYNNIALHVGLRILHENKLLVELEK